MRYQPLLVHVVWQHATFIDEFHEIQGIRQDPWGNPIRRWDYGQKTTYGWHIDAMIPAEDGETCHIKNMRPQHWDLTEMTYPEPQNHAVN